MGPRALTALCLAAIAAPQLAADEQPPRPTMASVLAAAPADAWRRLDPENLLVMRFAEARVVIELAPGFAPAHVANIKALARGGYFDGLSIVRVQDNFVAQWGDPDADSDARKALPQGARRTLPGEFERRDLTARQAGFVRLKDRDGYAREVGHAGGFPAARDPRTGAMWLAHCYATVGVGRDADADSGGGGELYAVIGHAPRQLDRNITVVGRVVAGIDALASLKRGSGPLGFYETPGERTRLIDVRVAADLAPEAQPRLEALRTDTPTFQALVEARRNRRDDWYKRPAGYIDLCNAPLPVRPAPTP